jgi:hypothetical protein
MTFRPTGYTSWAAGATNVAEPLDALKVRGYGVNEAPRSSYENWLKNKVDQFISYLDWKAQLAPVVSDHFVRATGINVTTGLYPIWNVKDAQEGSLSIAQARGFSGSRAMGAIRTDFSNNVGISSGTYEVTTTVGHLGDRDFAMEFLAWNVQPNASGIFEYGLWHPQTAGGQATGAMTFMSTGASGAMLLRLTPSGRGATLIGLGTYAYPQGYKAWRLERHGSTMAAFVDGVQVAVVPAVPVGMSGVPMRFGFRTHLWANGADIISLEVDKAELLVQANPS